MAALRGHTPGAAPGVVSLEAARRVARAAGAVPAHAFD